MEVLQRFTQGDLDAFEALFRQFQGQVYGWIIRIVRDRGAAEDLTVETFWRIYRAHARFNPEGNFGRLGSEDRHECSARPSEDGPARSCVARRSCGGAHPDPAVHREVHDRIVRAFRELPAKLQVPATLALVEEESYEQIAEGLGISVGAVKSRVFRALLPFVIVPIAITIAASLGFLAVTPRGFVLFQAITIHYTFVAIPFLGGPIAYYLIWKHLVGFFNELLGIA